MGEKADVSRCVFENYSTGEQQELLRRKRVAELKEALAYYADPDEYLAQASRLPQHSGDGYAWGGGAVLTIGPRTVVIGEGPGAFELAEEIARRWNIAAECKP